MENTQSLALVLTVLIAIAASLFAIFNYISTATLTPWMGLLLFLVVSVLLILGYMVGLIALALVALPLVPPLLGSKNPSSRKSGKGNQSVS